MSRVRVFTSLNGQRAVALIGDDKVKAAYSDRSIKGGKFYAAALNNTVEPWQLANDRTIGFAVASPSHTMVNAQARLVAGGQGLQVTNNKLVFGGVTEVFPLTDDHWFTGQYEALPPICPATILVSRFTGDSKVHKVGVYDARTRSWTLYTFDHDGDLRGRITATHDKQVRPIGSMGGSGADYAVTIPGGGTLSLNVEGMSYKRDKFPLLDITGYHFGVDTDKVTFWK